MINRIAIVGVGLMGGSLGLAFKKHRPDLHITGYDRSDVLEQAVQRGAIDTAAAEPEEAVAEADAVFLAVPLSKMPGLMETVAPHLKSDAILTDVGSVKSPILHQAKDVLPSRITYVGGHPMAGSEKGGIAHADAFLFENATYVLCPPSGMTAAEFTSDYSAFVDLIRLTGARLLILSAERHDRIAAVVSHLPQLLAVTLMNYAAELNAEDDAFLRLAAGGFRDMTRIASSPFDIWRDIIAGNESHILDALAGFATTFQKMRNRVFAEELDELQDSFESARKVRDTIPKNTKGFLYPLADIYVYAEDEPGVLLTITRTLFEARLNIKDIELLKIREGTGGAFRLSFVDEASADAAIAALRAIDYTAYRL
jgi:prephenate dehydrogenase